MAGAAKKKATYDDFYSIPENAAGAALARGRRNSARANGSLSL
ncbi:MAG: hypothetical protein ACLQJ7_18555 [Syntrophobacteraceae bacterium]